MAFEWPMLSFAPGDSLAKWMFDTLLKQVDSNLALVQPRETIQSMVLYESNALISCLLLAEFSDAFCNTHMHPVFVPKPGLLQCIPSSRNHYTSSLSMS